jgi:hypothetical protein
VGPNENYISLVVSPLQAGFLFQFWDIAKFASFSKKLAKLVEFTLGKKKLPIFKKLFSSNKKFVQENDCLSFTGKAM